MLTLFSDFVFIVAKILQDLNYFKQNPFVIQINFSNFANHMTEHLSRHKEMMDNIRTLFGEGNYARILEHLRIMHKIESVDNYKYLLSKEIDIYELRLKLNNIRKDNVQEEKLLQNVSESDNTTNKKEVESISLERDGVIYTIKNTLKHRMLHCAITYSMMWNKKISDFKANDHKEIAKMVNTTDDVIRSYLSRIVKDGKNGLTFEEKHYYIAWLADKNKSDVVKTLMPFLQTHHTMSDNKKTKIA